MKNCFNHALKGRLCVATINQVQSIFFPHLRIYIYYICYYSLLFSESRTYSPFSGVCRCGETGGEGNDGSYCGAEQRW